MATPQQTASLERLQEELAQKSEEVRVLRQMSSEVNATLNLDEIYEAVLGTMYDLFGFHHSLILLLDDSGETLRVVGSRGYEGPAVGAKVPLGVGVIGTVARRRKMMRVGNLGQTRSYAAAVRSEMALSEQADELGAIPKLPGLPNVEGQIAIPLIIKDTLVGVFAVESAARRVFTERDETLVSVVANLSASAIHNALLYRKQEEYSQSLAERVSERTQELAQRNQELEQTLEELKETQNQLIIKEKMASLGNLVSGVAHEINTPLGVLNSNNDTLSLALKKIGQLLEDRLAQGESWRDDKVRDVLQNMSSLTKFNAMAAERMIKIVMSLRTFARLDRADEDDVDIHEGLESTLTLIHNQLKDRVTVHKDYGDLPLVRCHPSQLNQVYMNLLVNASQAIEGKGEIRLKTYATEDAVAVEITDSGVGIPAENLNRVFDPGFTTKGVKVGSGLGLSIVRRILDDHNGKIEVESKVGEGSMFRVSLPIRPSPEPKA